MTRISSQDQHFDQYRYQDFFPRDQFFRYLTETKFSNKRDFFLGPNFSIPQKIVKSLETETKTETEKDLWYFLANFLPFGYFF